MGNSHGHKSRRNSSSSQQKQKSKHSPVWTKRFSGLANGEETITAEHFEQLGDEFGSCMWSYFSEGSSSIGVDQFIEKATPLFGTSTDIYVRILQDADKLLSVSSSLVDCEPSSTDIELIDGLKQSIGVHGDDWKACVEWKQREASRIADPLRLRFESLFSDIPVPSIPTPSIVTPFCMFFVRYSIPMQYLPPQGQEWNVLYSSTTSGMSKSRFENSVFGYKSSTVTFIRTVNAIYVLGVDVEWRHSDKLFGGPDAFLLRLSPNPILRYTGSSNIYCNLELRSAKMGLTWKKSDLDFDKDLSQVYEMEVWGCGGTAILEEHNKLKTWQKNQTEQRKKVPLPGNWDDNVDKTILEMAGFQFSRERENMEKEGRKE